MATKYLNIVDYSTFTQNLAKFASQTFKMDIYYSKADSRCWSALINQGNDNVIVTYHINKEHYGDHSFDILSSSRAYIGIEPEYIYDILDEILTPTVE